MSDRSTTDATSHEPGDKPTTGLSRRRFLAAATGVAGAAGLGGAGVVLRGGLEGSAAAAATTLPAPGASGIDHVVVVTMENRSFDHFLGWLPGANGKQSGLTYVDKLGIKHGTYHLTEYQGCDHPDPDHSYEGGRIQLDGGKCDGWLRSGASDEFAIGYYTDADLAFYRKAAPYWTSFDRYFSATMAETYPNRFYLHSAQTDRTHNSMDTATMPTIWDRLADKGVSHAYYFNDVPFLALYGTKYLDISKPYAGFLAACANGTLPSVSYVDPRFTDESSGSSADDHPHADIRAGQRFLNEVYTAVTASPQWARTALVITYDEWGGFYDHVSPGSAPDARPDLGTGLRGFRVPTLLISPRSRRRTVNHTTFDHASVLKMIEWRFGLTALTPRDAAATNLAQSLDFSRTPNLSAPQWTVPPIVGVPCPVASPEDFEEWGALKAQAASLGFPLP